MSKFLVRKEITKMMIADDKLAILFICTDGEHVMKVDGDCCSQSWIESVELPALGFPCLVTDVQDLDLPQPEDSDDFECLQVYGLKISTTSGDIVIDYRNESNGYYGGNACWPDEYFYGGVHGQNESTCQWIEIEDCDK